MLKYWRSATPAIEQQARYSAGTRMPVRRLLSGILPALMPDSRFPAHNTGVNLPCSTGRRKSVYPVPVTIVFAVVSSRPR